MSTQALSVRQQGVVLLIALIMLVSMTLAGIVMFRQIGTGVIIARNLTFRQGALTAADRGIEEARAWLTVQAATTLEQPNALRGYYPAWCNVSVNGSNVPDANGDGKVDNCNGDPDIIPTPPPPSTFAPRSYNWANSTLVTADDGTGNEVRYVIHRLCRIPGGLNNIGQQCVVANSSGSAKCHEAGECGPSDTPRPFFRITSRISGPMNTLVYTQATLY